MTGIRSIIGWATILTLLLAVTIGCPEAGSGKPTAHLQGKVTLGGQPIPAGAQASITFMPTGVDQANAVSVPIQNGTFDVADAPTGKVMVSFSILRDTGVVASSDGVGRPEPVYESLVPAGKAGGVEVQIDGDKSDLTFDL